MHEEAKKFFVNYFKQIALVFGGAWNGRKYSIRSASALRAFIRVAPDVIRRLDQEHADRTDFRAIGRVIAPWGRRIGDLRFETEGAWKRGGTTVDSLAKELRLALQYPEGAPFNRRAREARREKRCSACSAPSAVSLSGRGNAAHHRRRRLHRLQPRPLRPRPHRRPPRRRRQADLRGQPAEPRGGARRPARDVRARPTSPIAPRWRASSRTTGRRRCSTWPPRRTSIARSTARGRSSTPTSSAPSCCSRRRGPSPPGSTARRATAFRFLHVSTDEVYGTLGAERAVQRGDAVRAELAVRGEQGGGRSSGARVLPHLRPAGR